jgi:AAA family ATP:ADP antiporter
MSEESIVAWQEAYPRLRSLIAMTGNWSVTLFYTLVDVSGVNVVTFAFWQVAAQVTSLLDSKDVKRIYGAYAMYGNILGIIGAGYTGTLLGAWLSPEMLIRTRVTLIGIALLTAAGIYMYIYHVFLTEAEQDAAPTKSSKPKLSMAESVRLIAGSRYLACLAVIVLSYGVAINLVEVTWKDSLQTYCLQQCHGDKALSDVMFAGFLNELYTTMGFITFLTGIVGGGLTRRMGWLGAALITPGVLAITSLLFYVFALLSNPDLVGVVTADKVAAWCAVFGCTPLVVAVYSGYAQNILSKSTKYVLFDPSTQMTYAPLHEDLRVTGKAAIDVLGSKFGKIAGAVLQTALSILTGCTQQQLAPILMVAVMCVIIAWVYATIALKPMYEAELEAAERRKSEK